jgi:hypothetical protein
MLLGHPKSHIDIGLKFLVLILFDFHLIDYHGPHKLCVLVDAELFSLVRVDKVASRKIESGSLGHNINDYLDQSLLLEWI